MITTTTDQHGEPLTLTVDGVAYTPDALRRILARDAHQRRIIRVLCVALRRLNQQQDAHTAYLQQQHNRRLNADPDAPWLPRYEQES